MDYLNRGKEFKYIDVREGRESIDDCNKTNQRYTHHRQTDKHTYILHLYIIEFFIQITKTLKKIHPPSEIFCASEI